MRRLINGLVSFITLAALGLGILHRVRVRTARGMALRTLKSFAEALAPFLAVLAGLGALLGIFMRAPAAVLAGVLGALLHTGYVRSVTRDHDAFADSFGPGWQGLLKSTLDAAQLSRMLPRRWSWPFPRTALPPRWECDLVYHTAVDLNTGIERDLRCDLWQPPAGTPASRLALIYIHGGGYASSAKDFGTRTFFRHLAEQGHVVMDIDYRLAPAADLLEMLDDVHHAIAWMKVNAEWLGADPDQVVLIGGSAGAHLALLAAYAPNHSVLTSPEMREADLSVRAVVSYYGIVDLAAAYRKIRRFTESAPQARTLPEHMLDRPLAGKFIELAAWVRAVEPPAMREYLRDNQNLLKTGLNTAMERLLGGTPDEIPELYELVSPVTHAGAGCPPTLLFQGAHDYLLPLEPTRRLYEKLRGSGTPAAYIELPGTEHTFDLFLPDLSPPAQSALYDLDRFLMLVRKQPGLNS